MENQNENFDQLRKLLALKKHETPAPGYFNRLPGEVIARIRKVGDSKHDSLFYRLNKEAPWLVRLWSSWGAKPLFAGAFGVAVCSVLLAGIYFAEKPDAPEYAQPQQSTQQVPFATASVAANGQDTKPVLMTSTNPTDGMAPNLFDLINNQNSTEPASLTP